MTGPVGVSFVVPRMTLMSLFCTPSSFSRLDCDKGCGTQTIVNDAGYHTLIQQEQVTLFDAFAAMAFGADNTFLHFGFVDSACVL